MNARSDDVPEKPQAIAQASLAGGGDADAGRATSPLPAMAEVELGDASSAGASGRGSARRMAMRKSMVTRANGISAKSAFDRK